MKTLCKFKYIIDFLILLTFLIQYSYSSQYYKLQIEDDDLCSLIKKRKIKLGKTEKSALIIKQSRLNDHSLEWQTNIRCKFQVNSPFSRGGIFAVIQELSFRRNDTSGECIDFIQFIRRDGSTSPKYCGRFNAAVRMDHNFDHSFDTVPTKNSFIDDRGELDVYIFVSKEPLKSDEEMELTVVFTAYTYCSDNRRPEDMVPCSDNYNDYCIYKKFFLDTYYNCPYLDCLDENGCEQVDDELDDQLKPSVGSKVLIGSISTLFILFAIFVMLLWICRAYKVCCWSSNFANPSPTIEQAEPPTRVIEMNEQTGSRLAQAHGNTASAPIDEDKDLPPSYDSLFPTR